MPPGLEDLSPGGFVSIKPKTKRKGRMAPGMMGGMRALETSGLNATLPRGNRQGKRATSWKLESADRDTERVKRNNEFFKLIRAGLGKDTSKEGKPNNVTTPAGDEARRARKEKNDKRGKAQRK